MKALLVLDMQKGILAKKNFSSEKDLIKKMINRFKDQGNPVIFMKHKDENPESCIYSQSEDSEIENQFVKYIDYLVEKATPSAFLHTSLDDILRQNNVNHVVVVGFNTEYCCLFTSIAAFEKGYKVTVIEDATGTVNDGETYEMPGLNINDFVGSVLNWSNVIEVLYYSEYVDSYIGKGSNCNETSAYSN
ncbi:Nicotinamidase-related amidase [Bacillus sp. 491mf]|uniref:isochorismatase family protein n=1 Tax=Bacillus sp. 491mf TaxID=1761755 RepID=UPI0008E33750|nr:isochorismatase family protein [Bacillus sp. 491mf]SFC72919.1 Nicotinamidase-related amidase [Bacillus sp. 491mf]